MKKQVVLRRINVDLMAVLGLASAVSQAIFKHRKVNENPNLKGTTGTMESVQLLFACVQCYMIDVTVVF